MTADDGVRRESCLAALADAVTEVRAAAPRRPWASAGIAVLDAGRGVGDVAIDLASQVQPGGRVVSIDVSPDAAARAKAAVPARHRP